MARLHTTAIASAFVCLFAACSLIDPLDDVSSGNDANGTSSGSNATSSGAASSSSSGASGDDDDDDNGRDASSSSSGGPAFCSGGPSEVEPNESTATPLPVGIACGEISNAADVDQWTFENTTTDTMTVIFKLDAPEKLRYAMTGSNSISGESGNLVTTSLGAGKTLRVQVQAKTGSETAIPYRITFTAS